MIILMVSLWEAARSGIISTINISNDIICYVYDDSYYY